MAMTARERYSEYATMKAIGFSNGFVAFLIFAESMGIAIVGGALGIAGTFPVAAWFGAAMSQIFPVFIVSEETIVLQLAAALLVGLVAALIPAWRAAKVRIVDGLRAVA
jgi:putative ABC transport system permease protein